MKSTFIECSECAGHGGEGIYCEECLSTGHIVVCGPAAEVIDQLRADLAAATQRAEEAEAQALALQENIQAIAQDALNWVPLERWEAVMRRAEAAEAALAAVPVGAIIRMTSGIVLAADVEEFSAWMKMRQQPEVQP